MKEYYTLESLLFLLKNVGLSHPMYVQRAGVSFELTNVDHASACGVNTGVCISLSLPICIIMNVFLLSLIACRLKMFLSSSFRTEGLVDNVCD